MPNSSPPKHRHDGSSPLPLGMDWSPAPKRWDGRNTIWPHNPQTGWSYCVMIPSWIVQNEPGISHEGFLNPIVFYRIHVGIQSPDGISTSHGLLRRFSDFLKLYAAVKKAFPRKDIPPAPPKHAFLKINSSRVLLEERRNSLDEWMGKLLSDIDVSRSAPVAGFLDLETAARSSFGDHSETSANDSIAVTSSTPPRSSSSVDVSPTASVSHLVASDASSDNSYEASDMGTPIRRRAQVSGKNLRDPASNYDLVVPGGSVGNGRVSETILDHPEDFARSKLNHRKEHLALERNAFDASPSRETIPFRDGNETMSDLDHEKFSGHARKPSSESIGSDVSSIRGSELSITGTTAAVWDGSNDVIGSVSNSMDAFSGLDSQFLDDTQIVLPLDQGHKLNRVIVTMQRRLGTAKTDMEDLIARLNQEMAVKEYLTTKIKDLEVELEASKQKGKEALQQAILVERERVTQMQWDMDELRRKYSQMESKLNTEEYERSLAQSEKSIASDEKELLLQELNNKQVELERTQKHLEEVELKSKADIKVLVKEVKSLRNSQAELKKVLNQSLKDKTELEGVLLTERRRIAHAKSAKSKLLDECKVLRNRLQECSNNFVTEEMDGFNISPPSLSDALDLLTTSDDRIGLLLAEALLLARDDEAGFDVDHILTSENSESLLFTDDDNPITMDNEIRKMLSDILVDNARLRKQVNSVLRCALNIVVKPETEDSEEPPSRKTVLSRFLER